MIRCRICGPDRQAVCIVYVGRTKVKNLAELLVLPQCCEDETCFTPGYGPSQAQWCETTGPYQPVPPRLPTERGNGENSVSISQSHIEERNQSQVMRRGLCRRLEKYSAVKSMFPSHSQNVIPVLFQVKEFYLNIYASFMLYR